MTVCGCKAGSAGVSAPSFAQVLQPCQGLGPGIRQVVCDFVEASLWVSLLNQAARPQPAGLSTRLVDAGNLNNLPADRRGRVTSSPPQLGHWPWSTSSAQELQKMHY